MSSEIHIHSLGVLEFDAVLEMLADRTTSVLGREIALALKPGMDPTLIHERLSTVSEIRKILGSSHSIPIRGIKDIRASLERARVAGSTIDPEHLLDLGSTIQTSRLVHRFGRKIHTDLPSPRIESLVAGMGEFEPIEHEIARSIDEGGAVKDQASRALARIRREQHAVRDRTRDHLNRLMQSELGQKALQDQVVTMRDGRYVVPVRSDHKNQIKGVMHDQSASGATIFVEPLAVVEMNNELRGLEVEERREIDKVLSAITSLIRDQVEEISRSFALLGLIDFYYAAGQFSIDLQASQPRMNESGRIEIRNGRHPLLAFPPGHSGPVEQVVPLTIEIGSSSTTLVITGPNMGGKTVAIKTVGLLTLMAQAGLHIPADDPSDLAIFAEVFADIGDEQSIQANLSTFSAHLGHIVGILNEADDKTLVLLDELGSGTDPAAGAAMGMATLESLTSRRTVTIATTHFGTLKEFASRTEGIENGSMAFDVATLAPTYRFRQGIPGGSYAIEIGQRLGMPDDVLRRASEIIGQDERQLDDLIAELDRERQSHETTRLANELRQTELERLIKEYEAKLSDYQKKERDLLDRARGEADQLVSDARTTIERTVADIRTEQASRDSIKRANEAVVSQREQLRKLIAEPPESNQGEPVHDVTPGDRVWVQSLKQEATVVATSDSAGRVRVRAGNLELSVRSSELQKRDGGADNPRETIKTTKRAAKPAAHVEVGALSQGTQQLDLRGYTALDAIEEVDRYLDQAMVDGLLSVRILHGKGSGVLRKEIKEFLRNHALVKSAHFAPKNEGGDGVTIVDLAD